MTYTIKQKALCMGNSPRVGILTRIRYKAIGSGLIRPTNTDRKALTSGARQGVTVKPS